MYHVLHVFLQLNSMKKLDGSYEVRVKSAEIRKIRPPNPKLQGERNHQNRIIETISSNKRQSIKKSRMPQSQAHINGFSLSSANIEFFLSHTFVVR